MNDSVIDIAKYTTMRDAGKNPLEVTRAAVDDGYRTYQVIKMLREVFNLSPDKCKSLYLFATGSIETTDGFIPPMKAYLERLLDVPSSTEITPLNGGACDKR